MNSGGPGTTGLSTAGLSTMSRIQWRARWKGMLTWLVALTAALAATAVAIAGLYETPTQIQSYADAVSGGSLYAINGKVEGIASLGGIIQDEFAFIAAFLLPLLGMALIAGSTRREEEAGRLELLLSGRIGRRAPLLSALMLATGVIVALVVAFAVVVAAVGVPLSSSILYAASLGALAFVFVGVTAAMSQVALHTRGVYFGGFAVVLAAYVLRGIGDVNGSWVSWLSPLGWQEKTAPTGHQRWWVLLIPVIVGVALAALALRYTGRRDLGSALIRTGPGPARASRWLRSPLGFATWMHRQSMLGWLAGSVVLAVMMGALSQEVTDAMSSNSAMAAAMGVDEAHVADGFTAMIQVYLAIVAMGYTVHAVGVLRHEEDAQRLEMRLAGNLSRMRWLAAHAAVILAGLVVIVVVSSASFGITSAISTGESGQVLNLLRAGVAYLPAELIVAGLALTLFGALPRFFALSWGYYAGLTFVALLGPGLNWPQWILDLSPTTHVGNPPVGTAPTAALTVMTVIACALLASAFAGFRRRDIPNG